MKTFIGILVGVTLLTYFVALSYFFSFAWCTLTESILMLVIFYVAYLTKENK